MRRMVCLEVSQRGLCCIFSQSCVMPCLCREGSNDCWLEGWGRRWWGVRWVKMVRMGPKLHSGGIVSSQVFPDLGVCAQCCLGCTAKHTGNL